jgi:hypothetical protein
MSNPDASAGPYAGNEKKPIGGNIMAHASTTRYVLPSFSFFISIPSSLSFFIMCSISTLFFFCLSGTFPVVILANDTIVMNFVTNVIIVARQAATKESTRQHAVVQDLRFPVSARVRDAFRHFGVWHWRSRGRDIKRPPTSHVALYFRWDIARHSPASSRLRIHASTSFPPVFFCTDL